MSDPKPLIFRLQLYHFTGWQTAREADYQTDRPDLRGALSLGVVQQAGEWIVYRLPARRASDDAVEMPKYRCHKKVWALKISEVRLDSDDAQRENRDTDGTATLRPSESSYGPIRVDAAYVRKHNPQPGGYFVKYEDGYASFSPAKAFEDGYTRI